MLCETCEEWIPDEMYQFHMERYHQDVLERWETEIC